MFGPPRLCASISFEITQFNMHEVRFYREGMAMQPNGGIAIERQTYGSSQSQSGELMASEPIICEQLPVEHVYSWGKRRRLAGNFMIM